MLGHWRLTGAALRVGGGKWEHASCNSVVGVFKTRNYEMIEWRLTMRDTVKLYHTIIES